jgi:hypothetical protein
MPPSGKVVWSDPCTEVSQTAVSVLTNRIGSPKRLHTEAIRSDEVAHDTEVQFLARGLNRNSRCSRNRQKGIYLTEGDLKLWLEKSQRRLPAEVIVVEETSRDC